MPSSPPTVAPHRVQRAGIGTPLAPARARCTTCGWVSPEFYGLAAKARAMMAATGHQRCERCDGSRHVPGGELCPVCTGTGWRPEPVADDEPAGVL